MRLAARLGARIVLAFALVIVGWCIRPVVGTTQAQKPGTGQLFRSPIYPNTVVTDALPTPPVGIPVAHPWLVRDLDDVPEVLFQRGEVGPKKPRPEPKTFAEQEEALQRERDEQQKAHEKTAQMMAGINRVNAKGNDLFIEALRDNRADIAGLPFVLGGACRLGAERGAAFVKGVAVVRKSMPVAVDPKAPPRDPADQATRFWVAFTMRTVWRKGQSRGNGAGASDVTAERIAALMQVLGPEHCAFHKRLVKYLSETDGSAATVALARLAIYSFDREVRTAALVALKTRPSADTTDVLLAGLRFPWPAVAENASEAVVQLGRKDLVPKLVALLDEADPRAPAEAVVNGKKTLAVRELVRLNHNRSCLLCHPPANLTADKLDGDGTSPDIVTAPVPNPDQPSRSLSQSGYDSLGTSPDILIRADVTYLRQDFSLMAQVADDQPAQHTERFDFLVRTRAVPATARAEYQGWLQQQGGGYLAPHQRAAVAALRALTGRDPATPTAAAWRAALAK
jgi:hypothetical protein